MTASASPSGSGKASSSRQDRSPAWMISATSRVRRDGRGTGGPFPRWANSPASPTRIGFRDPGGGEGSRQSAACRRDSQDAQTLSRDLWALALEVPDSRSATQEPARRRQGPRCCPRSSRVRGLVDDLLRLADRGLHRPLHPCLRGLRHDHLLEEEDLEVAELPLTIGGIEDRERPRLSRKRQEPGNSPRIETEALAAVVAEGVPAESRGH